MMSFLSWNEQQIFTFFFVLLRVTTLMFFLPIYGDKQIPAPIKICFGIAFSCVVHPLVWGSGQRIPMDIVNSPYQLVVAIFSEIAFGVMLGFVARWIFDGVLFAGQFIGSSIGFSMASMLDPHTETQTVAIAELQYVLAALLFLAIDGHHMYLSAIIDSTKLVSLGASSLLNSNEELYKYLIKVTSEVIMFGIKLSAPVVVIILVINMTFGVLARAVPQLNALVISFAANIIIGMFVVIISLPAFTSMVNSAFDNYGQDLAHFMKLFGH